MVDIPLGTLLLLSSGNWDDYGTDALYRVVKEIPINITEIYFEEFPEQKERGFFNHFVFSEWLENNGYVKPITYSELHVSGYRGLDMTLTNYSGSSKDRLL